MHNRGRSQTRNSTSPFSIKLVKQDQERERDDLDADDMEPFELDHSADSLLKDKDKDKERDSSYSSLSLLNEKHQSLSFMVIVAFTVNYVMGTGFLTLPWAFYECGPVLGGLVLLFMIGPSIMSVSFVLETIARANLLSEIPTNIVISSLVDEKGSATISSLPIVGSRKFETTELCEIFLGNTGKRAYTLSIAIFLYGTLWAYSTVFANALVAHFDFFGSYSYSIYLLLFSLIVIPLSCMELSEQLYLQVILSLCRIVMVLCMIITVLVAYFSHDDLFNLGDQSPPSSSLHWSTIKWNGLHIILPLAVYSNMFHHSIPSLSEPAADKKKLSYMFATSLLCCFFAYTLIGVIVSLYFGEAILSSSNLNWKGFGYHSPPSTSHFVLFLQRCVSFFVIIFPALDVASAFPLNAITLGNNLFTSFHSDDTKSYSKNTLLTYRLAACIPPLLLAELVSDLGTITDYTGITGMFVVFIFPGLLCIASERLLKSKGIPTTTYYSSIFSSRKAALLVILFGSSMVVFTMVSFIMQ